MIGSGLKKLAKQNGMTVDAGVAYGSLKGFATTLLEGSGYKCIQVVTGFPDSAQRDEFWRMVSQVDLTRIYRVRSINQDTRGITVVFNDNPGTMKKLEAFVEWFYPLLQQYGATGVQICPECGLEAVDGSWYLLNERAYRLHDGCAQKVQRELEEYEQQRKEEDTGSYVRGLLGALIGAALGAVVWAIVLLLGYVASLVGLLIGWLAQKGYTLLRGKQGKGKIWILIVAIIFGVVLGTFASDAITIVRMINAEELLGFTYADIPSLIIYLLRTDAGYASAVAGNVVMGLLFAALGVFALLRRTSREVSAPKMKKLG